MGIFSKISGRTQEWIVARASAKRLETMAKSSRSKTLRLLAAERLNREDIWQYMAIHDSGNYDSAMRSCKDLQFLKKLSELKPENKIIIHDQMDRAAFDVVQKKIETCSDQDKLFALVMHGKTDIPEYEYLYRNSIGTIQSQALSKITDQENLFQIAMKKDRDTSQKAISSINDPDVLVRIALAPKLLIIDYNEVLSRLHDTNRLQYIAEHSQDSYIVQQAKIRVKEERSLQMCNNHHDWIELSTETDDDGDSPRFDYKYEKCSKCGVVRCSTYISGRFHKAELRYSTGE